jgi:hypothetical protein
MMLTINTPDASPKTEYWPWVRSVTLRKKIDLSRHIESDLRKKLRENIYWVKAGTDHGGRLIFWNERLVVDYMLYGNRPEHGAMIESFLSSQRGAA